MKRNHLESVTGVVFGLVDFLSSGAGRNKSALGTLDFEFFHSVYATIQATGRLHQLPEFIKLWGFGFCHWFDIIGSDEDVTPEQGVFLC